MVELCPAQLSDRETLRNLLEKYQYEFSQWDMETVHEDGLFHYPYLDCYFEEENRFPYLIRVDGKLAGFVLVNDYPEVPGRRTDWCLSEFFVMHPYRRLGVGRAAAMAAFDAHRGTWQLKRHPKNLASVCFWDSVVADYTGGKFELIRAYPDREVDYGDGTAADVFFFRN